MSRYDLMLRLLRAAFACCALVTSRGAATPDASAGAPVEARSWRTHPRIVGIRRAVEASEAAIRRGEWRREERRVCSMDERPLEANVVAFRDQRGRVRKYVTSVGTDDSAYTAEHHYDESGRLRFVFAKAGAANDSVDTYRLYFDERGAEFWRHVASSGPGYTFMRPPEFPDAAMVCDPVKDLATPVDCEARYGRSPGMK